MRTDDPIDAARRVLALAALWLLLLPAGGVHAQAKDANAPKQVTYPLPLRDMAGVDNGQMAVVQGKTGPRGHRFQVDKLWMTHPVRVTLMAETSGDIVQLDLIKFPWDKPVRSVKTGADARFVMEPFRTHGEFLIHVTSPVEDTPYQLVVWVGKEVDPDLPKVVVDWKTYEAGTGGGSFGRWWPWFAAVGLGGVLLVAIVILRRRKS